jgi:hypothetical protein
MRRAALFGGLLVLALGFAVLVVPFLVRDRAMLATTPQPPAPTALALVELRSGQRACLDKAVMDERSDRAQITVGTYGRTASPLELTISGPGVHEAARIPPSYRDNSTLTIPVQPPDKAVVTTICVRNAGDRKLALYGGADRTSRSTTRVDGKPIPANFTVLFAEARRHTLLERLPLAVERMQAFRPDAPWLAWLVAVLFVIGMPLAVVWAFAGAAQADETGDAEAS